jgi:hypothetical protein
MELHAVVEFVDHRSTAVMDDAVRRGGVPSRQGEAERIMRPIRGLARLTDQPPTSHNFTFTS